MYLCNTMRKVLLSISCKLHNPLKTTAKSANRIKELRETKLKNGPKESKTFKLVKQITAEIKFQLCFREGPFLMTSK